jgi:nucleoside-diphosphate-sugar epimerase
MKKTVSILGCGWVGQALKETLEPDYHVNCLSRNIEENFQKGYYNSDTLLVAIPPRENYLEVLTETLYYVDKKCQLIFLSSTSFYDGKALVLEGEELIQELHSEVLILRLSGLMGYNRIAGKYTAGRTKPHDAKVNYVHRDDVVQIIQLCIEQNVKCEQFDVTAPNHPKQSEVYRQNAEQFGWENTYFDSTEVIGKSVSSEKLIKYFDYEFIYPDPLGFWERLDNFGY